MKEIVALQSIIAEEEERITFSRRQLMQHETGENKLTAMIKASIETKLDESVESLAKHQSMLDELMKQDLQKLEEEERLKEAAQRSYYYHYQKVRLKRDKVRSNDVKLEAMMIVDELPTDVQFEDEEIFEISSTMVELHLRTHEKIYEELENIKKDFSKLLKNFDKESISDLGMLRYRIPIVVLHFSVLLSNILENIQEDELAAFKGFPKYEDWWIQELWNSHQAYFALFKWKSIISNLCITNDQKRAWEIIFSNWIFIKKMLNGKGALGFEFNFAFDALISSYAQLEEELSEVNLLSMEAIIKNITKNEDFNTVCANHNIITPYLKFKRTKSTSVEVK
ncbi:MAG: hypothetical protein U9N30_06770 [Campylobacterota bacterium]|nr:hypothetical protein [Campylobacterota bacterium]